MGFLFDHKATQNFDEAITKEWLETNGLGGYSSSTIIGANTRRYHGLLVAATQPPVGRMVLLSKLDETVIINDERFELGCNQYPNAVHPQGHLYLSSFKKDFFPVFEYHAGDVKLRKIIAATDGENTTLVLYEILSAPKSFQLELQPFIAGRDFHSLSHANDFIRKEVTFGKNILKVQPYEGVPEFFISIPKAKFHQEPLWYYNFEYPVEKYRGLDFHEDLFSPGKFILNLKKGDRLGVIISTENPSGRDALQLLQKEKRRRQSLFLPLKIKNDLTKTLTLAADQFIVRREKFKSVIAGYHWFADWGRDTMIALPGLCLVTGRFDDAEKILKAFAQHINQGMLPNRFPDISTTLNAGVGDEPEYNTVDATLWFFVAVYKFLQYVETKPSRFQKPGRFESSEEFVRDELMPVLTDILNWHERGTRYNISMDGDGLLYAGEAGVQLTWMDAKVGDWVVTPRQGKAVEINALWYNVLEIFAELSQRFNNSSEAHTYKKLANTVKTRFRQLFWNEEQGYLYDVVDGDHKDAALRPNQIFALSLPFPLLRGEKAKKVLNSIEEKLLTPFGLRSLSPDDPNYHPHYGGDQLSRDGAYHQGTVWSWLLGPFITALVRIKGKAGKKQAQKIIKAIQPHFGEEGVGSISEIFDGDSPHATRGCIAQAWGVAEVLRAYVEDLS